MRSGRAKSRALELQAKTGWSFVTCLEFVRAEMATERDRAEAKARAVEVEREIANRAPSRP